MVYIKIEQFLRSTEQIAFQKLFLETSSRLYLYITFLLRYKYIFSVLFVCVVHCVAFKILQIYEKNTYDVERCLKKSLVSIFSLVYLARNF